MSDAFNFGEPAKHSARTAKAPRPARPSSEGGAKNAKALVLGAVVIGVVVVIVGFMKFVGSSGSQIAQDQSTVVAQVGVAQDAEAQTNAQAAIYAARTGMAASGSYAGLDSVKMKSIEPTFTYTAGLSTGPTVLSVASSDTSVAFAVLSTSGHCFYVKDTSGTGTTYGAGAATCTGQAALTSAVAPAW